MKTLSEDKEAIRELIARFADAVTRFDAESFGPLWAEDGEWVIGEPMSLTINGLTNIKTTFDQIVCKWDFFAQFANPVLIEIHGDEAKARCICEEFGINSKSGETYHNIALYLDKLGRTDTGWRFERREYRYLWLDDRPLSGRIFAGPKPIR